MKPSEKAAILFLALTILYYFLRGLVLLASFPEGKELQISHVGWGAFILLCVTLICQAIEAKND